MMLDGLVRFVESDTGRLYGRVCAYYGRSPGAILDDDVLAFNLDAALYALDSASVAVPPEPGATPAPGAVVTDLEEQMALMERQRG